MAALRLLFLCAFVYLAMIDADDYTDELIDFSYKLCKKTKCKTERAKYKKECKLNQKLNNILNQDLSSKCRILHEKVWVFCLMPCIQVYFDEPNQTQLKMKLTEEKRQKSMKKLTSQLKNIKRSIRFK